MELAPVAELDYACFDMDDGEITLNDIIIHLQKMSHDSRESFRQIDSRLDSIHARLVQIEGKLDDLSQEVASNYEDLTATMRDAAKVRKHVGLV